ncbi:glycosyltransferase [Microbacterium sp.]|uniref:glycosyltransferase n=1 Tax=Microbacterium sp. TaxID=51671 RepID=UPI0028A76435|nr:glycosyltransferase [Microbacterium sp.]
MAEYNTDPSHLWQAINSLAGQTFTDFELLIVDDGGRNDLKRIVREFPNIRIRIIGDGTNRGFTGALNYGLATIETEYLARMDTDDWAESNYLERLWISVQEFPEFDVISACAREFSEDQSSMILGVPGEKTRRDIMRGSTPIHPASIMRREAINLVGGYPDYKRAEDLALWCELILAGRRLYMIPDVLLNYRVNRQDFQKRRLRHRAGEIRARLYYYPLMGARPREYLKVLKSIVSGALPIDLVRLIRKRIHPSA